MSENKPCSCEGIAASLIRNPTRSPPKACIYEVKVEVWKYISQREEKREEGFGRTSLASSGTFYQFGSGIATCYTFGRLDSGDMSPSEVWQAS